MLKKTLIILPAAILLGAVSGAWSAQAYMKGSFGGLSVSNGQWQTDPGIGSRDAGPYTRATIATRGLLALSKSEAVYFFSDRDLEGPRFEEGCSYRLLINDLPARWWSITLYAEDEFLPKNEDAAFSISKTNFSGSDIESNEVLISAVRSDAEHWVSSKGAGAFSLTLRLYHPDPELVQSFGSVQLPRVERQECEAEA